MSEQTTAQALKVIVDIAKERCEQSGHACDWECALLGRSIGTVREALALNEQLQGHERAEATNEFSAVQQTVIDVLVEVGRLRAENAAQAARIAAFLQPHVLVLRVIAWTDEDGVLHATEHTVCGYCVPEHSYFGRREDIPEGPCATRRAFAPAGEAPDGC